MAEALEKEQDDPLSVLVQLIECEEEQELVRLSQFSVGLPLMASQDFEEMLKSVHSRERAWTEAELWEDIPDDILAAAEPCIPAAAGPAVLEPSGQDILLPIRCSSPEPTDLELVNAAILQEAAEATARYRSRVPKLWDSPPEEAAARPYGPERSAEYRRNRLRLKKHN